MFSFNSLRKVPVDGGRGVGGGLVEDKGRVVWGGPDGVFMLDEGEWRRVGDGGAWRGTLAVCGERLVWIGGLKDGGYSNEVRELRGGRWSTWSHMLVGCRYSCVVSVNGGGMVVMGGEGDRRRHLNDVQVFDGETKTWHRGPSLPRPCDSMSAVVHGDQVFVMGGDGMAREVWFADIRDLVSH